VTETTKSGWDLTNVSPSSNNTTCTFSVNYPQDAGQTFSCSFTNVERSKVKVVKTVSTKAPTGTQSFEFQLFTGASTTTVGTMIAGQDFFANAGNGGVINFTALLAPFDAQGNPNHYQLCEIVMPGWNTNLGVYGTLFVPGSMLTPTLPNPNVNNMTVCVDFT